MSGSLFSVMVIRDSDCGKSAAKILNYFEKYSLRLRVFFRLKRLENEK